MLATKIKRIAKKYGLQVDRTEKLCRHLKCLEPADFAKLNDSFFCLPDKTDGGFAMIEFF